MANCDAVVWFAYPEGTSKRYHCELNRGTGWEVLGKLDLKPSGAWPFDEDWTGARFRRVEFIKTMTRARERALTAQGKSRTARH
jgi:hypothetical protein